MAPTIDPQELPVAEIAQAEMTSTLAQREHVTSEKVNFSV